MTADTPWVITDLRACGGCADDLARKLGADVAITGEIQKVSNLILNINVYVKDLKARTPEQAYSVDIRGDNDLSFEHGVKYLVKNRMPLPGSEHDAAQDQHNWDCLRYFIAEAMRAKI